MKIQPPYGNKYTNKGYEYDIMKCILLAQHTHEELIGTTKNAQQNSHDQKDLVSLYCDMVECMYVGKKQLIITTCNPV